MPKLSKRPSYEPKVEHNDLKQNFFFLKLSFKPFEDI